MTYRQEMKFRVRLVLANAQLLPVSRDGRDLSAQFTVHSVAGPRFAPVEGQVRVGASGTLLATWEIERPAEITVALIALAVQYLANRIRDGAITGNEELQLTTYNALGIERPQVEGGPRLGPFDIDFSRWVPVG